MSRVGKKPIDVPNGVKTEIKGSAVTVSGPLGSLKLNCRPQIKVEADNNAHQILVKNDQPQDRLSKQLHGTTRALIANMVIGVSKGFEKKMEIYGTGYSVKEQGEKLIFQIGYSRQMELVVPKSVKVTIEAGATRGDEVPAKLTLTSVDKQALGQLAADIRKIRPPEPYKGKGIRYADERVRHKVGKAFSSGAA
jgi:large subunit ribosomal protein L6